MDIVINISVILMLCGVGHAKVLLTGIQGKNATIYIDALQTDINAALEINFFGYTSTRHFTNVLLYRPGHGQIENISINSNYTGRIQNIVWRNANFSFLLLNADFKDSGNYTVREFSFERGNTGFLVARQILPAHPGERITFSFTLHKTTMSSIKIDFKFNRTVLLYNVTKDDCTSTDIVVVEDMEIQKCALKTGTLSFTFLNVSWLHKGSVFAWDFKGRLLDSVFIDVEENREAAPSSPNTENVTVKRLLISALVIALVAVFLFVIGFRKYRRRRVHKTTTHNLKHKNRNETDSSRNECQNLMKALISERNRTGSTKIISEKHADLRNNKVQAKLIMNDKNIYAKVVDFEKSLTRTACKLQSDSKLLLSDTAPQNDSVLEYDKLKTVCLTDCISKESCLCSNALGNEATNITVDPSSEYDYVVKHTFMTLRPPAPDPAVLMKHKKKTEIEKFLYSIKNVNIKPLSRVLPATLYARLEKKRAKKTQCTGSSVELKSLELTNELSPPCSFVSDNHLTMLTIDYPKVSKHGECQKRSKAKCISSPIFMYKPESSKLQDSKARSLSRCLSFDYSRNDCNDASGMNKEHKRSRSHDAVC